MSQEARGALRGLRQTNQERLLSLLLEKGPLHRAALARHAGVSRTTVTTIVNDLVERGLVVETDETPSEDYDGRARELLSINPRAAAVVGMNHTFDAVWVHVANLSAQEIASSGTALDPACEPGERDAAGAELPSRLLAGHGLRAGPGCGP